MPFESTRELAKRDRLTDKERKTWLTIRVGAKDTEGVVDDNKRVGFGEKNDGKFEGSLLFENDGFVVDAGETGSLLGWVDGLRDVQIEGVNVGTLLTRDKLDDGLTVGGRITSSADGTILDIRKVVGAMLGRVLGLVDMDGRILLRIASEDGSKVGDIVEGSLLGSAEGLVDI